MNRKTVGGVVGRFQVAGHTPGHIELIKTALTENDRIVFFFGCTGGQGTDSDPLSFDLRKRLIEMVFVGDLERITFVPIYDRGENFAWSYDLDSLMDQEVSDSECVTFYAGRDGFLEQYKGRYETKYVETVADSITGTESRTNFTWDDVPCIKSAAMGIILTMNGRYPTAHHPVDVAILTPDHKKILLGRKPNEKLYRFIGGFVDPGESADKAAVREVHEEVGPDIQISEPIHIASCVVDDIRYRRSKDGISSTLYRTYYEGGACVANDDIAEVKWFELNDTTILSNLMRLHLGLYVELRDHLQRAGISLAA